MAKSKSARTGSIWNRVFLLCMIVSALSGISNGMLSPALPIYVESLGRGTEIAGTIVAIATFLSMFGRGLSGGWSGIFNRKSILLVALAGKTASFILFCFADTIPLLLIAKCMQGVASGIVITLLATVAYDTLPPEILGSGIGMYTLAGSLAQCIAPSIGTELATRGLYNILFLSSAVAAAGSFAVLLTIPVAPTELARARAQAKKDGTFQPRGFHISDYICKEALPAAFILLMNGVIHAAVSNYLSICGISRGIKSVAVFFTINSIVLILSRPACGKLADKKPIGWLIVPGYILMGAGCLLIAIAQNMIPICAAAVCYGVGFGATQTAGQLSAIRSVDLDRRSIANSTYYVGGDIGLTLGAYFAGALAAQFSYGVMYTIIAGACIFTLLCFVGYSLRRRAAHRGAPEPQKN